MDNPFNVIGPACCSSEKKEVKTPSLNQQFVTDAVTTPAGEIPVVKSELTWRDHWGTIKARWGVGRMDYAIDPGLYALGSPDGKSPVLISANYKMSFDELRKALPGRSAWILVLDTDGINVWCAAGKGTFGTEELVMRIETSGLKDVVDHRDLILPQLAGPGVAAHRVKKLSGFTVHYGPIKAVDLPAYMDAGLKATAEMRQKSFTLRERTVLIPVELTHILNPLLIILPVLFLLAGLGGPGGFWSNAVDYGLFAVLAFLSAVAAGSIMNPILLPYVPGRAFSTKGIIIGLAMAAAVLYLRGYDLHMWSGLVETISWFLIIPAISAYLAMNFTGCSTYTSLSGVRKEMRWALPLEITMASCGFLGWLTSRLIS